ncbi:mannosyl-oligosaccharide glucosidase GCS1-like [Amaranthus tricolor]|uniref:mannosyl-oligosaccharide glucosidase GCS1-like n=1 Tax=Amaranthus tricolor TaxID=29722 RepID=UPI00258AEFBD|nr:mannosyl-oligosaccharide glucosidase GCS1-like [Amaranthus tricolor]
MPGNSRKDARNRLKSSIDVDEDHQSIYTNKKSNLKLKRDKGRIRSSSRFTFLIGFSAIFVFAISIYLMYSYCMSSFDYGSRKPRFITPFPAPKLMDLPQFQGEHKESLYWGTYRPHVYLGIRARTPQSLIAGLMWIGVKDGQYFMRHVCQDSDELSTYGWTHHNGRDYGRQLIVDHGLILETSFLKLRGKGSGYGGDWAVRIDVQSKRSGSEETAWGSGHFFFYLADESGYPISLSRDVLDLDESSVLASGSQRDYGGWQLHLKSADNLEIHYSGFKSPHIHNLSDLVQVNLAHQIRRFSRLQLPDDPGYSPNIFVFQISAMVPFKADFAFISGTDMEDPRIDERISSLTGESLSKILGEKKSEFDDKFQRCFNLTEKVDSEAMLVGKAAIANMLGGIGYFYGQSKISMPKKSDTKGKDYLLYWPAELYTAVPSRSFFPRGFLWDEGFHQLLIWRWDVSICLDIVGHWLDLLNIDGWIPREQILGAEALSKVPEEFVLQHPTNGNPPTLFLVLHDLVSGVEMGKFSASENSKISSFLDRAFVRLDAWYKWFNTSQSGKDPYTYFWHGRDNVTIRELNPKTLSSGLDDYPRASHPSDNERHLDLRCWMLLAADCLHTIAKLSEKLDELGKEYAFTANQLSNFKVLNQIHFDEAYGAYFDFGNHTEKVLLRSQLRVNENYASQEMVREVLEKPKLQFVPHLGYISLFPFMGKLIPPESWILGRQLELISNRSTLWTNYGIRSLSKTSSLYMKRNTEHDPPYWRGPVWMNMNYMILSALHHYSKVDGPYKMKAKTIYEDLRSNLIRNIIHNFGNTGYLWEQYDQKTGKGKGARPFTGWTSLVLLIMSESYSSSWGVLNS